MSFKKSSIIIMAAMTILCFHPASTQAKTSLAKASVTLKQTSMVYTGTVRKPAVSRVKLAKKTLKAGKDYTVSYSNNVNAGSKATVIVKGKGNYKGSVKKTFKITPVKYSSVSGNTNARDYTGEAQTISGLSVTAKVNGKNKTLTLGRDYTVSYKNNVNVGMAKATITGKGNFTGTSTKTFEIAPVFIGSVTAQESFNYTGKAIQPSVTVQTKVNGTLKTLRAGTDYTVSYANNVNPGTANITVKGIGNYRGTQQKTFKIIKKTTPLTPLQKKIVTEIENVISDATYFQKISVDGAQASDYEAALTSIIENDEYGYCPEIMSCGDKTWAHDYVSKLLYPTGLYIVGNDFKLTKQYSATNKQYAAQWCKNANVLASDSDRVKVTKINHYIADQVTYDLEYGDADDIFRLKRGRCSAYAEAAYCMYKVSGIPAKIVSGTAGEENHAWNLVLIEGKWMHTDSCWTDTKIPNVYNDAYLLSETGWRTRTVRDTYGY